MLPSPSPHYQDSFDIVVKKNKQISGSKLSSDTMSVYISECNVLQGSLDSPTTTFSVFENYLCGRTLIQTGLDEDTTAKYDFNFNSFSFDGTSTLQIYMKCNLKICSVEETERNSCLGVTSWPVTECTDSDFSLM